MACGILPPMWANLISDSRLDGYMAECMIVGKHEIHAFKTPEGRCFIWGTDWECECEDCQSDDSDDRCIIWNGITEEEFKHLTGQT